MRAARRKRISLLLIAASACFGWSNVHAILSCSPFCSRRAPLYSSNDDDDGIGAAYSTIVTQSLFERNSSLWCNGSTEVNFAENYFVLHNFTIDNSINSTLTDEPFAVSVKRVKVA
jgi:hypothetical protein